MAWSIRDRILEQRTINIRFKGYQLESSVPLRYLS